MSPIRWLSLFNRILNKVEHSILSLTVIIMSVLLIGNAFSRHFFSRSWTFTEEIGKIGVVVITFIGIGYAARKGMHIEMSGIYDMMSKKWQQVVSIFINLGSAIVLGIFTYLSIRYVQHLYDLGQVTTILRYPLYITMLVIPIGFLFGTIQYTVEFYKTITNKHA